MEEKRNVLVIGRGEESVEKMFTQLSKNYFNAFSAMTNEEALASFVENKIEAVVLLAGIDKQSKKYIHDTFSRLNANVKIFESQQQTILDDLKEAFREENKFKY